MTADQIGEVMEAITTTGFAIVACDLPFQDFRAVYTVGRTMHDQPELIMASTSTPVHALRVMLAKVVEWSHLHGLAAVIPAGTALAGPLLVDFAEVDDAPVEIARHLYPHMKLLEITSPGADQRWPKRSL